MLTKDSASKHFKMSRTVSMDVKGVEVKPALLESRVSSSKNFASMSNFYQKVFTNDKADVKMVIPVVGYGGHRRGDRAQNFFGKNFRETTIQSKYLERDLRRTQR